MNIVTIDFDIIMEPSINLYNPIVGNGDEDFLYENTIFKYSNANLTTYNKLTVWLLKQIKRISNDNIHFIVSHQQAINFINDKEDNYLINIDHHHDLGYKPLEVEEKDQRVYCGNWVKYLLDKNIIKQYVWLHNANSEFSSDKITKNVIEENIENYNLDNLRVDKIIICLSPEWVPPQYRDLFYTWMNIIANITEQDYILIENNQKI